MIIVPICQQMQPSRPHEPAAAWEKGTFDTLGFRGQFFHLQENQRLPPRLAVITNRYAKEFLDAHDDDLLAVPAMETLDEWAAELEWIQCARFVGRPDAELRHHIVLPASARATRLAHWHRSTDTHKRHAKETGSVSIKGQASTRWTLLARRSGRKKLNGHSASTLIVVAQRSSSRKTVRPATPMGPAGEARPPSKRGSFDIRRPRRPSAGSTVGSTHYDGVGQRRPGSLINAENSRPEGDSREPTRGFEPRTPSLRVKCSTN